MISVHDFTSKIVSRDSNYVVDMVMWPKFGNSSISMKEVTLTSILQGFDQKSHFFEECSCFKINNLRLALGMAMKFYTGVVLKLKVKF